MSEKVKDNFWKAAYVIVFGGFGYALMESLLNYRDNMRACGSNFQDLYERVECLENNNENFEKKA